MVKIKKSFYVRCKINSKSIQKKKRETQKIKKTSFKAMQYKKNQRMFLFLSIEAVMFLFFLSTEARHVLSMFLIFKKFEPQRSYKHGSYSRKSVYRS